MLRLGGPTKLAALSVGIVVSAFHQHMVVGTDVSCHILFVGLGDGILRRAEIFLKARHRHRPPGDARHIIGSGIVVLIRQAVRVGKVGIAQSQRRHLLVHQLRKVGQVPAHRLGYGIGAVIGGFHHRPVQRILQGNDLPRLQRQVGGLAPLPYIAYRFLRNGDAVLRLGVGQPQRCCQYLGNAGRILLLVHVFLQQHLPGLGVHHHIGIAVGFRHIILRRHGRCYRAGCYYHHRCQQQRRYSLHSVRSPLKWGIFLL